MLVDGWMAEEWVGSYCVERWFGARGVREKLALQEGSVYPICGGSRGRMRWYLELVIRWRVCFSVAEPGHSHARRPALGGGCSSYPEGESNGDTASHVCRGRSAWAPLACTGRIIRQAVRQVDRQIHVRQHEHGHRHNGSALSSVDVGGGWARSRP